MYTYFIVYKPITDIAVFDYSKSLVNYFFTSVTLLCCKSKHESLHISTGRILQLALYHWQKSETVEDLKLNLAEHHMKYLRILKPDLQLLQ